MRTYTEIQQTLEAALGQVPCDLVLKNVRLVNVFSGEIYPTEIYIRGRRIVSITPGAALEARETLDGGGRYALPGLIDAHMHFESTMLSPEALAAVVVPQGTTTLCADLMEIANVAGAPGLEAMLQAMDRLPYRMLIEVSSRVPTAPGLETTGATLDAEQVAAIMDWPASVSLGEIDPSKILFPKPEYLHKIADTLARRKIVNGHAIGRLGRELDAYAGSGVSDDHECVDTDELNARLRAGMKVFIREGSSERNVDALIRGVLDRRLPTDNLCFCTDDKHAHEIRAEGHINYNVRRAIALGMAPIQALQIATLNAAKHFRLEDEIGSLTPGRLADILLVSDLNTVEPSLVLFEGRVVARDGILTTPCPVPAYPDWIRDTVHLKRPVTAASFALPAPAGQARVRARVIQLIDTQIINRAREETLEVVNGLVQNDLARDVLKLAVVERYGKNGNIGIGFVQGFGLERGALSYSMSHDHHNIVVVGTNDADMAAAVNAVSRLHGGLAVVCDGRVLSEMALPIGGLMSELDADAVMEGLERANAAARILGTPLSAPFMTLSFISLPTVPELGLTDLGLVDVLTHRLIPLFYTED